MAGGVKSKLKPAARDSLLPCCTAKGNGGVRAQHLTRASTFSASQRLPSDSFTLWPVIYFPEAPRYPKNPAILAPEALKPARGNP